MASISKRCQVNLTEIIAKVPKRLLESPSNPASIDLSIAENHLVRKEVLELVSAEIQNQLTVEVSGAGASGHS